MGEIGIDTERVSYVQYVGEDPETEHMFELVLEDEAQSAASHVDYIKSMVRDPKRAMSAEGKRRLRRLRR